MSEKIGVTYRPIYVGSVHTGGYHMALFYDNGKEAKVIEVGPTTPPPSPFLQARATLNEHFFSNGNTDSPWGRIDGGERDWRRTDELLPHAILAEGDNLSSQWNLVKAKLEEVKRRGYEYQSPVDQNSNTFVRDAAETARLPVPNGIGRDIDGSIGRYWTPGARHLSNPINPDGPATNSIPSTDRWPSALLNPAPMDSAASGAFGSGGQFVPGSASSSRPLYESRSFVAPQESAAPPDAAKDIRVLRRIDRKSNVFNSGAPAVPFATENGISGQGRPASFEDRFGSWPSAPAGAPIGSYQQQTASTQPDESMPPTDPRNIRVLSRTVVRGGTRSGTSSSPAISSQLQPQTTRPLGVITGQPIPAYPVPPMVFGLPDRSAASGDDMDDWFARWIKPLMEQ